MTMGVGDRGILLRLGDGRMVLVGSKKAEVGDRALLLEDDTGRKVAVVPSKLSVGDRVVVIETDGGRLVALGRQQQGIEPSGYATLTEQFIIDMNMQDTYPWYFDCYSGMFGSTSYLFMNMSMDSSAGLVQRARTFSGSTGALVDSWDDTTFPLNFALSGYDCRGGTYDGTNANQLVFHTPGGPWFLKSLCLTGVPALCAGCNPTYNSCWTWDMGSFTVLGGDGAEPWWWGVGKSGSSITLCKVDKLTKGIDASRVFTPEGDFNGHTFGTFYAVAGGATGCYVYEAYNNDESKGRIWKFSSDLELLDCKYMPTNYQLQNYQCRPVGYWGSPFFGGTEECIWVGQVEEYIGGTYHNHLHVYKMTPF